MRTFMSIVAVALALLWTLPASGQVLPGGGEGPGGDAPAAGVPAGLTPEQVDAMLARMTDADIRALLRDELIRRSEARAPGDAGLGATLAQIETRLTAMAGTIDARVTRWAAALRAIEDRGPIVADRLALAAHGTAGMVLAALAVLAAGLAAAFAVGSLTGPWRAWLARQGRGGYWDKVVATLALGILQTLPIVAFVAATRAVAPWLAAPLGPLIDYLWIYTAGVSWPWAFIVILRRAFAPDAPAIRIAPLGDDLAGRLYRLLRLAVRIGAAGWLIGGMILHLGLGFPPVMVTRALAGTVVAAVLLAGLWRNRAAISEATALVFGGTGGGGAFGRIATAAAPAALGAYIAVAWAYWLAHWLETGRDRLAGPAGTLIVYLALPILDRMGREIVGSLIRRRTPAAARFRAVFQGAWRLATGIAGLILIAWLWGLDLVGLAKGPDAPGWASTAFDIALALALGWLVWRLIGAALHTEQRVSDAAEDADPADVPGASRLGTLIPLFRNALLAALAIVVAMIVLSAIGVDIGPLIASAGIVGIAIGFGAQSLVRDIFSGIFFLIDDAFRVGEYIELDPELRGEVEAISIRSLQLRHHRGPVITIPFGELKQITNHNRDWVIYKMSFRMEPDTDPQVFKKIVKEVGKEFLAHPEHGPKFLEPLKSQGVYFIDDDSALVMRVKFKCKPRAQFVLRREIYHRLSAVFEERGLHLARRKVEVVGSEGERAPEARGAAAEAALPAQPAAGGG